MSGFDHLHLSAQGFLFDHHSGISYSMNTVGAFIMRLLIQGEEKDAVLERLARDYDVSRDRASQDLSEFMLLLRQHSLLQKDDNQ
jgi:hypothetical protein